MSTLWKQTHNGIIDRTTGNTITVTGSVSQNEQEQRDQIFAMLPFAEQYDPEEIEDVMEFRSELDGVSVEGALSAERMCIAVHEALKRFRRIRKPLKGHLQQFAKEVSEAVENSGWEY